MAEFNQFLWEETPVDVTAEANFIWSIANKLRGSYMPDKYGDGDKRSRIVRNYMDYCSEHPELTLTKCEDELIEKGCVPLVTKR